MNKIKRFLTVVTLLLGISVMCYADYTELEKSKIIKEIKGRRMDGIFSPKIEELVNWMANVSYVSESVITFDVLDGEEKAVSILGIQSPHLKVYVPFVFVGNKIYMGDKISKEFGTSFPGAQSEIEAEFIYSKVRFSQKEVMQFVKTKNFLQDEVKKDEYAYEESLVKETKETNIAAINHWLETGEFNKDMRDLIMSKLLICELQDNSSFKTVKDLFQYIFGDLWKWEPVKVKVEQPADRAFGSNAVYRMLYCKPTYLQGVLTEIYVEVPFKFWFADDKSDVINVEYVYNKRQGVGVDIYGVTAPDSSTPYFFGLGFEGFLEYYKNDREGLKRIMNAK